MPIEHPHKLHTNFLISNSQPACRDCTLIMNSTNGLLIQSAGFGGKKGNLRLTYSSLTNSYMFFGMTCRPQHVHRKQCTRTFSCTFSFYNLDISCGSLACPVQVCLFFTRRQPVSTCKDSCDKGLTI